MTRKLDQAVLFCHFFLFCFNPLETNLLISFLPLSFAVCHMMQLNHLFKNNCSQIQRVPALRAFWDLEKTVLHEIRVSGTVVNPLLMRKSPTCTYISQKPW